MIVFRRVGNIYRPLAIHTFMRKIYNDINLKALNIKEIENPINVTFRYHNVRM